MARKRLFTPDERYTELGIQLDREVAEYAAQLLEKYKDCPTRDVEDIATSALTYQAVFTRLRRQCDAAKRKREAAKKKRDAAKKKGRRR